MSALRFIAVATTLLPLLAISRAADPPCALPTFTVRGVYWFNSTSNVNCPDDKSTFCYFGSCVVPVCATGISVTPPGYGPPDLLEVNITELSPFVPSDGYIGRRCTASNPGSVPARVIGTGDFVHCGGTAYPIQFLGDSNSDQGLGKVSFDRTVTCEDGQTYSVHADGTFPLVCERDAGGNATCVTESTPIDVPVTSWW